MLRLHTFRIGLAPTRRIAIAFAALGLLLAGASWVAYDSYSKSRDLTAVARQDRQDALTAERAISEFWRERESVGEYVMVPSGPIAREVQLRQQAFRALASQGLAATASPESRGEAVFFTRAVKANAALVAISTDGRLDRNDPVAVREVVQKLHDAEAAVLAPLSAVDRLNQLQYSRREAEARSATRDALHIELASALLALAGIAWFAVFATGLVRRVDSRNAALQEADELKDEFINTISHERHRHGHDRGGGQQALRALFPHALCEGRKHSRHGARADDHEVNRRSARRHDRRHERARHGHRVHDLALGRLRRCGAAAGADGQRACRPGEPLSDSYSRPIDQTASRGFSPHVIAPLPATASAVDSSSAVRQSRYSKLP